MSDNKVITVTVKVIDSHGHTQGESITLNVGRLPDDAILCRSVFDAQSALGREALIFSVSTVFGELQIPYTLPAL